MQNRARLSSRFVEVALPLGDGDLVGELTASSMVMASRWPRALHEDGRHSGARTWLSRCGIQSYGLPSGPPAGGRPGRCHRLDSGRW